MPRAEIGDPPGRSVLDLSPVTAAADRLLARAQLPPTAHFNRLAALKAYSVISGTTVSAIGAFVLLGWMLDVSFLKRMMPGMVAMNPATAVSFILCGGALLIVASRRSAEWRRVAETLACLAMLLGLVRLFGYMFGSEVWIDRVLFSRAVEREPIPNRMAPNTAFAFVFVSAALLLLATGKRRLVRPAHFLCYPVALIALFTVSAHLYATPSFARVATAIPMALHTAIAFTILASGILTYRIVLGPARILASAAIGGRIARPLFLTAFVLPITMGWLRFEGEQRGWYGTNTGIALMVIQTMVLLQALIWWTARKLDQFDAERREADATIEKLIASVESRSRLLETTNKELEAFSYSVSHDLRSPLRSLGGFSQLLIDDYSDRLDETGVDYLRRIRAASQRMGHLIDVLIEHARVTRAELHLETVDLTEMAREMAARLQSENSGRTVTFEIENGLQTIGDRGLLRVALQNLMDNAWKFTARQPRARIEVGRTKAAGPAAFFVRDNGAGFDMKYAGKLFGAFQRLHTDKDFPGTGIGLATVERIITRHGGSIRAEGRVNEGATFHFTLAQ